VKISGERVTHARTLARSHENGVARTEENGHVVQESGEFGTACFGAGIGRLVNVCQDILFFYFLEKWKLWFLWSFWRALRQIDKTD
jgi:hypothetical protein